MNEKTLLTANYTLFIGFALLATAIQCSAWPQFLGTFPAPQLWITVLVYWLLYRDPFEGMIMTYLVTALASTQSALPFSLFISVVLILYGLVFLVKQRIYWAGSGFFVMMTGVCAVAFHLVHLALSHAVETSPILSPEIYYWIISSLLTMLFSLALYHLFYFFDVITKKERPTEVGSEIL